MRKLYVSKIFALFVFLISGDAIAQGKLFAVSGQGRGNSPADARQAAEISQLQANITARNTCESAGLIYSPGHAEADADGCIPPGTGAAGVPSGAVLPFNLAACPDGWSTFSSANGRFIVGTGSLGADSYSLGGTGGAARVTLSIAQMPSHAHSVGIRGLGNAFSGGSGMSAMYPGGSTGTTAAGGNQPHENRPPYLALLYCQKD